MSAAPDAAPSIRRAGTADLRALVALEAGSFEHPWSAALLRTELESPHSVVLLACRPGAPGGVSGYAAFQIAADEAELLRVAVHPGERRRGLGVELVRAGITRAVARGAARCFLEVRTDNRPAIELYRRLGFGERGRRNGYYADGADALVMALELADQGGLRIGRRSGGPPS